MKRVLFVSYIFPPMVAGGALRVGQFAKYLPEFGWQPTILTVPFSSSTAVDLRAVNELPDAVDVLRAYCPVDRAVPRGSGGPRRGLKGALNRVARGVTRFSSLPDRQVLWYPRAMRAGREALQAKAHDAVLATYRPATNFLVGARLARAFRLPLVLDYRDLWSDNPLIPWASPFHHWICRYLECKWVRQAAKMIGVSPGMQRFLAERHGRPPEDVFNVTNGFDPVDVTKVQDRRDGNDAKRPFRLCYTGSVYGPYKLETFAHAVRDLAAKGTLTPETFRIQFIGKLSPDEPHLWGIPEFVDACPPVAHHEVFEALATADAMLMIEAPGYWAEYSYAVKIFDYLLTGKPVLGLVEAHGNSGRLLQSTGVGYVAHPYDRTAIAETITRLIATKGSVPHPVDIDREPLHAFNRRVLTERLAEVLDAAVAGQGL